MKTVIDYSFARPDLKKIKSLGYDGVMRYLSYGSAKNLTADELKAIFKAKLKCGLVWETGAQAMKGGAKAGKEDAKMALHYAGLFGFPEETPIYFAADWDTTEADQKPIDEYLKACADAIGKERVGVYGSFYVVERCHKNKTAKWFWQTLAWSGKQVSKHNHILQDLKEPGIAGTDHNTAGDEWGGWDGTTVPKEGEKHAEVKIDDIPEVVQGVNQPQEQDMQTANSFDPVTVQKIGRGALIAGFGAVAVYLLQSVAGMDFGSATPIVVAIASIALNALKEYLAGN